MTLVAVGLAMWPMLQLLVHWHDRMPGQDFLPEEFWKATLVFMFALFFALPAAGTGALFNRAIPGFVVGLIIAGVVFACLPGVE